MLGRAILFVKCMKLILSMHEIDLSGIDLNLLLALHALLEERHVTRAAQRIGLSQSATSHALARLRELFADPLLVRSSQGMVLTPRAEQLIEPLRQTLAEIDRMLHPPDFDPQLAQGTLRLAATDYATTVLLPAVLKRLSVEAPHLNLECHHWSDNTLSELRSGSLDLALTGPRQPDLSEFNFHKLFVEDFTSVVRAGHPLTTSELTLDTYIAWSHALVTLTDSRAGYVDKVLAQHRVKRRIMLKLPHFLAAVTIVAQTDLVLTLPRRLATLFTNFADLQVLEPPIQLDRFDYILLWHFRQNADPLHLWIRCLFIEESKSI